MTRIAGGDPVKVITDRQRAMAITALEREVVSDGQVYLAMSSEGMAAEGLNAALELITQAAPRYTRLLEGVEK